jgi:hypothetical protein
MLSDDQVQDLKDAFPEGKREKEKKEAMSPALRKRAQRQREKTAKENANDDEQAFHLKNRLALPAETLKALLEQEQRVRDVMASMGLAGEPVPPEWEGTIDFISVEDAAKEVVELVKEFGVAHLGDIHKNADIPPDWTSQAYWRDSTLLKKLYAENEPTAHYVKLGLLTALPDWRVVEFLQKAGWSWAKAADLVGYRLAAGNVCC